jgi:hypothetical protein
VRVTTGSSTTEDEAGYWGYRLLKAVGHEIKGLSFQPRWGWKSVPSGNFWIIGAGVPSPDFAPVGEKDLLYTVHSGLPVPLEGVLRASLPDVPEGYRFPTEGGRALVADVGRSEVGWNVYYLKLKVPPVRSGMVPVPKGEEERVKVRWERASGNRTPVVSFTSGEEGAQPGHAIRFDGSASYDPEGRPLVQHIWDFGDGNSARGQTVSHSYERTGTYNVSLLAIDDCGAFARYGTAVRVSPPPSCSFGGGACAATSAVLVVFGLVVLGWWMWRRRGRRTRR